MENTKDFFVINSMSKNKISELLNAGEFYVLLLEIDYLSLKGEFCDVLDEIEKFKATLKNNAIVFSLGTKEFVALVKKQHIERFKKLIEDSFVFANVILLGNFESQNSSFDFLCKTETTSNEINETNETDEINEINETSEEVEAIETDETIEVIEVNENDESQENVSQETTEEYKQSILGEITKVCEQSVLEEATEECEQPILEATVEECEQPVLEEITEECKQPLLEESTNIIETENSNDRLFYKPKSDVWCAVINIEELKPCVRNIKVTIYPTEYKEKRMTVNQIVIVDDLVNTRVYTGANVVFGFDGIRLNVTSRFVNGKLSVMCFKEKEDKSQLEMDIKIIEGDKIPDCFGVKVKDEEIYPIKEVANGGYSFALYNPTENKVSMNTEGVITIEEKTYALCVDDKSIELLKV